MIGNRLKRNRLKRKIDNEQKLIFAREFLEENQNFLLNM